VTPDRLSLRYQFHRGKSQSITHFHMKHQPIALVIAALTAVNAIVRSSSVAFCSCCQFTGPHRSSWLFDRLAGRLVGFRRCSVSNRSYTAGKQALTIEPADRIYLLAEIVHPPDNDRVVQNRWLEQLFEKSAL